MSSIQARRAALRRIVPAVLLALVLFGCDDDNDAPAPQEAPSVPPPADTAAPTVSLTPLPATVNRVVALEATATDAVGVAQVEFRVDGSPIAADTSAPYQASWDTSSVAEGAHTLTAVATDAAGNSTTSAPANVTVRNQPSLAVTLSGLEENPKNASAASGQASFQVNLVTGAITGAVTLTGLTATAAHIHDGFAGTNGPIIVGLEQDTTDPSRWQVPANTALTSANVDRLLAGALYVNAHSAAFPDGEVRGQLRPDDIRVYFSDLTAREEPGFVAAAGTARGALTVDTDTRAATAHVTLTGVPDPTAAHIHQGFAGANGPVRVGLTQDSADPAHFFVEGATLDQADFDALLAGALYFNVHTAVNPDGHVRGQIVPPDIVVAISDLEGLQEVPAVTSAARARSAVTFDRDTNALQIHLHQQGADDATAAHLHRGVAGVSGDIAVGLAQDTAAPTHWFVEGATLTPEDAQLLLTARTYVNLHTPANPAGALRGQVVPPGMTVLVDPMDGNQEIPPQSTTAQGVAALTVDTTSGAAEAHVNASGVDDATEAHVYAGFAGINGESVFALARDADPARPGHWLATGVTLPAELLPSLRAGRLYANVHTPAAPGGLIRGQLLPDGVQLTITELTGAAAVPPVTTEATARASATVDTNARTVAMHVNTTGLEDASAVQIHVAPAGANGPVVIELERNTGTPSLWSIAGATITDAQLQDYLANNWYVAVHTPTNPDGEVRGQIIASPGAPPPPSPGDTQPPTVTLGPVPPTITGTVTLTATATDDVGVTIVRFKVNGTEVGSDDTAPYSFDWDSTAVPNGQVTLTAEAADAAGNVGTSAAAAATVSNVTGPVPFTFTEIQTQVFDQSCALSGCHTGSSPPQGLNLSAGTSYGNLVGVASTEVPARLRVAPGDAANSYLIHKLEGAPDIVGARMPFGGPPLSADVIARIRAWIDAGAPNN